MFFIGIDPGLTGCIALIKQDRRKRTTKIVDLFDVPTIPRGAGGASVKNEVNPVLLREWFDEWVVMHGIVSDGFRVMIEYQASRPLSASGAVFSMGDTYGCLRTAVLLQGWDYKTVTPSSWKKHFGLTKEKGAAPEPSNVMKERSLKKARDYWGDDPSIRLAKHHNRAEALLIAQYSVETFSPGKESEYPYYFRSSSNR